MKIAILSDLHSNLAALRAVLADGTSREVHEWICLGDIVGYGPKPRECFELVTGLTRWCLLGNHDLATADSAFSLRGTREDVADGILVARNAMDREQLEEMLRWPLTSLIHGLACSHASLHEPHRFLYIHNEEDARHHMDAVSGPLSFSGHTHRPLAWIRSAESLVAVPGVGTINLDPACRYAVNVGSVGQPRDGDPRACYVIYDRHDQTVTWRRVAYDLHATQAAMASLGMSPMAAERLAGGK